MMPWARTGWDPLELALGGGEDYELLFTCTRQAEALLCVPHFGIGKITKRSSFADPDRRISGFDHFKK